MKPAKFQIIPGESMGEKYYDVFRVHDRYTTFASGPYKSEEEAQKYILSN